MFLLTFPLIYEKMVAAQYICLEHMERTNVAWLKKSSPVFPLKKHTHYHSNKRIDVLEYARLTKVRDELGPLDGTHKQ